MKLKKLAASLLAAAMLFCGTATTAFADGGCDVDLDDILEGIEIGIPGIDIDDIDDIDIDVVKKWDRGTAEGEIKLPDPDDVNVKVKYGNDKWVSVDVDWDDEDDLATVIPAKADSVTWEGDIDLEVIIKAIIADIKNNITSSGGKAIQANGGFGLGAELKNELKTILQKVITALTQSGTNMFGEEITGTDANQWRLESTTFKLWDRFRLDPTLTLTNTYIGDNGDGGDEEEEEDTVSITVNKVWKGDENYLNARPEKITVRLLADNKVVEGKTLTLSAGNNWTDKFTDLKKYKDNTTTQEKITYTVEEVEVLKGYEAEVTGSVENGFIITNTYKAPVEIKQEYFAIEKVTKVWDDSEDLYENRPSEITVQLYADNAVVAGKTLTLNAGNNWTGNFENLPKYQEENGAVKVDSNNQPTEIEYTVKETNVPVGYEAQVNGFEITNKLKTTSVTVTKDWNDQGNIDGNHPDSVQVQLKNGVSNVGTPVELNDNNQWTYTFVNLPEYVEGEKVSYTVEEVNVPTGYKAEVTGSVEDGFTITNTYTGDKEENPVSFTKVFKLENGAKASDVAGHKFTFTLTPLPVELRETRIIKSKTVTVYYNANGVKVTFEDVPEGSYTLTESAVDGWETDIPNGVEVVVSANGVTFGGKSYSEEKPFTVTNTYKKTDSTPIDRDDEEEEKKDESDLTVKKVDSKTGKLITEKATFRIYKLSGSRKLYYTGSSWSSNVEKAKEYSTKNGKFTAYDLGAGTYYVEEVKAPSGYNLADDLKVKLTSKDKTVEFANSKAKQNPNTGALVLPLDLADAAVAAMTLGAAAWVISKSKK